MIRHSLLLLTIVIAGMDVHFCSPTFPSKLLSSRIVHLCQGDSIIISSGFNRRSFNDQRKTGVLGLAMQWYALRTVFAKLSEALTHVYSE